MLNSVDWF